MTKFYRVGLFSSLYFAQGMLMSYFLTFNILYLGEAGYTAGQVGIFQAVLVLPFVLKILLGMLSDGVNLFGLGHRKPYIAVGLVGQIVTMAVAPRVSVAEGLTAFAVLAFAASISMALYDTCTDGLALDTTPENERGTIQGFMVSARAAGILLMLVGGGRIAQEVGWDWVFYAISGISFLPLALLFTSGLKETEAVIGNRQPFQWSAFKSFKSNTVVLFGIIGFIYAISLDGILTFLSDYLREMMEVSLGNIGLLVALSMVGRIFGALTNNWVTDKIGYQQSLFVAIGLTTIGCLGLAFVGGVAGVGLFGFIFGLAYGYYTAVYAAVAMKFCDSRIAASMFAIFMMFINLGTVGGQVFGGLLTEKSGFTVMVIVLGLFNLVNLPLVFQVFRKTERPVFQAEAT